MTNPIFFTQVYEAIVLHFTDLFTLHLEYSLTRFGVGLTIDRDEPYGA